MYRVNYYPPPSPPPRVAWVRWVIVGASVSVLLVSAVGFVAYRFGMKRAASPPPTAKTAPIATLAPTTTAPIVASEPAIVDEPVPPAGTPASSLRARPPWGKLEIGVRGSPTQQYAPQPSKPLEAFLEASPISSDLDRAFVICRFQSFNKADTFAGDDLHVRATFGSTPEVAQDGPEDANLGFVSAPLVTMKKGAPMRFEVYDRDVFSMATITKPQMPFAAAPVVMTDSGAAIECRQLSGAALTSAVTKYTSSADVATARVVHAHLTGQGADWGWPTHDIHASQRAIGDVAAFVGWDDARAKKRVDGLANATTKLEAERPAVFAKLHGPANEAVAIGNVHLSLESLACGGHNGVAGACVVKLAIKNDGDKPVRFGGFLGAQTYVATAKTGPVAITLEGGGLSSLDIAGKSAGSVTLSAPAGLDAESSIVGVCIAPDVLAPTRCGVVKTH
jgi:hypothetical protein